MKVYPYIYNMMIATILLITVLYVLPLIGCYVWIHKAYSQGGIYEGMEPEGVEFWSTILPIFNIFLVFSLWENMPLRGQKHIKHNYISKFFGIKK